MNTTLLRIRIIFKIIPQKWDQLPVLKKSHTHGKIPENTDTARDYEVRLDQHPSPLCHQSITTTAEPHHGRSCTSWCVSVGMMGPGETNSVFRT